MRVADYWDLLTLSSAKSNKFWGISGAPRTGARSKHTTIVEYGRIGRTPQYHHYDSFGQAQDVMHAKLRKGYAKAFDIAHDEICCEDSDTIMAHDYESNGVAFHLCLGCGSRIDHSDEHANLSRFINQSLHRRSYGTKGGSNV